MQYSKSLAKRAGLLVISSNKASSVFKNCSLGFLFLLFSSVWGFCFCFERIAFLYQTHSECKIICQMHHVFSGHTSKTGLDATCLITPRVMPVLILLECSMNGTKSNIIYVIFLKNDIQSKKWWWLKKTWSELGQSYHHIINYTASEMFSNIS